MSIFRNKQVTSKVKEGSETCSVVWFRDDDDSEQRTGSRTGGDGVNDVEILFGSREN